MTKLLGAAIVLMCLLLLPREGAAQQQCGLGGYGVAMCPNYYGQQNRNREYETPETGYVQPLDDCAKTGWGIPECPNFDKEWKPRVTGRPGYQQPLDDCMKSGWGITECPNYGRKTATE